MPDLSSLDSGSAPYIFDPPMLRPPMVCAECGLQIGAQQLADECDLCGAPRCSACASDAGDSLAGHYICSACAED